MDRFDLRCTPPIIAPGVDSRIISNPSSSISRSTSSCFRFATISLKSSRHRLMRMRSRFFISIRRE